jgi:hypothetical protein
MYLAEPQVIYKPHCHYQNFSPLANGVYLIAIINKPSLRNGNYPITDPIAEMGVAHTVGQRQLDLCYYEFFYSSNRIYQNRKKLHCLAERIAC